MSRKRLTPEQISAMLREANVFIEGWRQENTSFRSHSSLGYKAPAPEAQRLENLR